MKEEGSEAPTPHTSVAPILETMSVAPVVVTHSTSVSGGEFIQDELASQRDDLVVYGSHLPSRKCGAYRKKLAKLRREAEGNLRPLQQKGQVPTAQSRKDSKRKKRETDTPLSAFRGVKRLRRAGVCPLGAEA